MKQIIALAFAGLLLAACNDTATKTETVETSDTVAPVTTTTTTTTSNYTASEGDISRRNGKVMVMHNGEWVEADAEVKLDNGVVIYRDGRVVNADKEMELQEGEIISKTGAFFDRTGNAIENAWDDTRRGVKKAGKAVGDAARKLGDKVEDAVNDSN